MTMPRIKGKKLDFLLLSVFKNQFEEGAVMVTHLVLTSLAVEATEAATKEMRLLFDVGRNINSGSLNGVIKKSRQQQNL